MALSNPTLLGFERAPPYQPLRHTILTSRPSLTPPYRGLSGSAAPRVATLHPVHPPPRPSPTRVKWGPGRPTQIRKGVAARARRPGGRRRARTPLDPGLGRPDRQTQTPVRWGQRGPGIETMYKNIAVAEALSGAILPGSRSAHPNTERGGSARAPPGRPKGGPDPTRPGSGSARMS